MNRVLFVYQNAFSVVGGIQTFNKYFMSSLEHIQEVSGAFNVELLSIYDKKEDVKSHLPFETLHGKKLSAPLALISKARSFDTFIFGHVNLAPLASIVKILNPKARIIFCTHGIDVWHKLPKTTEWIMNKSTVLAVSTFTAGELKKYNPMLKDVVLFPNCIELQQEGKELPNPFDVNHFNVLSVTRLDKHEQYKGIHTVIAALSILIKKIPNIRYTIIGKGDDTARLKTLCASLGVADHVDFLGFVDDIQAYYQHCDIFTLPSKKEGFGIVYLEAMQYKKPVIAVNYGGPTDVILDGGTGYLCEYDDAQCLADKIELLFNDPTLSQTLGKNGYQRLMENFTYDHYRKNLETVLFGS